MGTVPVSVVENQIVEHAPEDVASGAVRAPGEAGTTSRVDLMAARRSEREARTRVRRRRLFRRTVLPLCVVLVAVGAVAAFVATSGTGGRQPAAGHRRAQAAPGSSSTSPAPATKAAGAIGGAGAPLPAPTVAKPLRVLVVGDGLAGDVGTELAGELAPGGVVDVTVDARPGSGLARTAPVDWRAQLATDLASSHPSLVVVVMGSNDRVSIAGSSGTVAYGGAGWIGAYEALVRGFDAQITASGARVLWIGMPPMAAATTSLAMQELDGVYQDVALSAPGTVYLASWPLLASPSGQFASALTTGNGTTVTVRTTDGQRLTPAGALLVSRSAVTAIDAAWHLRLRP